MSSRNIAIIGAGLGGLASACLLAARGHTVTVYEQNSRAGGKINEVKAGGYRFDTGPSLLTMPGRLRKLFSSCNANIDNYLNIEPVAPTCRYFYPDNTVFDAFSDTGRTLKEVRRIAPEDEEAYSRFLDYAAELYRRTADSFLFNPLHDLDDLTSLNFSDLLKIDALRTVASRVDARFRSSYLRRFFKRFTTYNGSSPFRAPATLNVIPHVELDMGAFYIDGGMYRLIEALEELARSKGAAFQYNSKVQSIKVTNGKAAGLEFNNKTVKADLVLANSDAHATYQELLPQEELSFLHKKRLEAAEPSCSGLVLLLGTDRRFEQLQHHNIFFSDNYEKEFEQIFTRKVMPDDPTIYIADTSARNPGHAADGGSNLFVLVNAPYLTDSWKWDDQRNRYEQHIIDELEKRGLKGLREAIQYRSAITPVDFYKRYHSYRGSIYGTSSNSKAAAFLRPGNKAREVEGLYLTGGSTHPGGGIPLVIQSAFNAAELICRYE